MVEKGIHTKLADKGFNAETTNLMMTMMSPMLEEQSLLTLAIQMFIKRITRFSSEDITRFLEFYKYELTHGETNVHMVLQINPHSLCLSED